MGDNFFHQVFRYLRIWLRTSYYSVRINLSSRGASLMYIIGKIIRFFFFFWLLAIVGSKQQLIGGFNLSQLITFFLVFNLFDIIGQLFFRGIYTLRGDIISGQLDFWLKRPLNPLFQVLTKDTDLLDLPILVIIFWLFLRQGLSINSTQVLFFMVMGATSFLLVTAIHAFIAAVGVMTTEVDSLIFMYRDFSSMARVPVDIYAFPVRAFLTFVVPVGIIMTFPAKVLMGLVSGSTVFFSLLGSLVLFWLSLRFWRFALKKYSSASS